MRIGRWLSISIAAAALFVLADEGIDARDRGGLVGGVVASVTQTVDTTTTAVTETVAEVEPVSEPVTMAVQQSTTAVTATVDVAAPAVAEAVPVVVETVEQTAEPVAELVAPVTDVVSVAVPDEAPAAVQPTEVAIDRSNMHAAQEGMMEEGLIAMTINGPWREGNLVRAGINYAVAKLPTLPNGQPMKPFAGVQAMLVNAYSEQQDAALDFITYATGTMSSVKLFAADRKVLARTSAQADPSVTATPNIAAWAEQLAESIAMPNVPAMSRVWTPWGAAMDAIIPPNASDEDVQELLDNAVEQIRGAIEEFQG